MYVLGKLSFCFSLFLIINNNDDDENNNLGMYSMEWLGTYEEQGRAKP